MYEEDYDYEGERTSTGTPARVPRTLKAMKTTLLTPFFRRA